METNHTVESLKAFERKIAKHYEDGHIKAPVHLRGSADGKYEQFLIDLFKTIQPDDYIFGYWAFHLHSLLKGVPEDELEKSILAGDSIALSFPDQHILCSGIVGSLMGVATGTAYALKKRQSNQRVWCFLGDMSAETGIFYEAFKYARNFDLPAMFIIEDNGLSVMTDTKKSWENPTPIGQTLFEYYPKYSRYIEYTNEWPHSGINKKVNF